MKLTKKRVAIATAAAALATIGIFGGTYANTEQRHSQQLTMPVLRNSI